MKRKNRTKMISNQAIQNLAVTEYDTSICANHIKLSLEEDQAV